MARGLKKEKAEIRQKTGESFEHRQTLRGLTDSQVVQASLDGDARAFNELVSRYDQRLLNFVYRQRRIEIGPHVLERRCRSNERDQDLRSSIR